MNVMMGVYYGTITLSHTQDEISTLEHTRDESMIYRGYICMHIGKEEKTETLFYLLSLNLFTNQSYPTMMDSVVCAFEI